MNRFDLEQQIQNILNVCDDLDLLTENILENDLSIDDISNVTIGLSAILKLKQEKLLDVFKQVFKLDQYNTQSSII
jgi:hypothetical protein